MPNMLDQMVEEMLQSISENITSRVSKAGTGGGGGGGGMGGNPPIPANSLDSTYAVSGAASQIAGDAGKVVASLGALPGVNQSVNYQLAMSQARSMGVAPTYAVAENFVENAAKKGIAVNIMDPAVMAQQAGLMGMAGSNYKDYQASATQMSNLMPGLGLAAGGQSFASMQTGRNVNMLRAFGINIRDMQTSNISDLNEIVDQVWAMLKRLAGKTPDEDDLNLSLLPGNFLHKFVTTYMGDQTMQQAIIQALYAKARGVKKITQKSLKKAGMLTNAVTSEADVTESAFKTLQAAHGAIASGAEEAADELHMLGEAAHALAETMGAPFYWGYGYSERYSAGNGSPIPGMATGGATQSTKPYIIGERGPELFVPTQDGYIVPNHYLPQEFSKTGFSETFKYAAEGSEVVTGSVWKPTLSSGQRGKNHIKWAKDLLRELGAPLSDSNINAIATWLHYEGSSNTNNPLGLTGFNTSGKEYNSAGVDIYKTRAEGVRNTIKTLTGKNSADRGYTKIVDALMKDKGLDLVLDAIGTSGWVTGKKSSKGTYDWTEVNGNDSFVKSLATAAKSGLYSADLADKNNVLPQKAIDALKADNYGAMGWADISNRSGWLSSMGGWLSSTLNKSVTSIGEHLSSLTRGGAPGRAAGGPVRRGAEYTVGEAGAEVFVPNGYSAGGGSGNITVQKIEINVPSHFTEEKMIRELKQQLATGDIIKRTRTK